MTNTNTPVGKGRLALNNVVYDVAKDAALIYLPAFSVMYATLATLWGWPAVDQVVGTIIAFDTFLGVVLKISTKSYNNSAKSTDGRFIVDQSDPTKDIYTLDVTTPLEDVADANKITLKVDNQTPPPSSM